jgi:hypothetical protein
MQRRGHPYVTIACHSTWRKGRRPPPLAFSPWKRTQSPGKSGRNDQSQNDEKYLQTRLVQMQGRTTEIVVSPVQVRVLPPSPKGPPGWSHDRVAARSFASVRLVVLAPIQTRCNLVGLPPVRSHELLEALVTTSPFDQDAAVPHRPDDGPDDQRLTGERPEPMPDRRLERVAELVASGPPLDVDQLVAIDSTEHDAVRATAAASPAAEGDGGNRRAECLECLPDRLAAQELAPAGAEPRLMDARGLAPGRGAARLIWEGPYTSGTNERATRARRAAAWAVVSCSGSGPDSARPARPGRSGTTRRAIGRGRSSAGGVWLVRRAEIDRVRPHRADPEVRRRRLGGTRVSPGGSEDERGIAARPLRVH